MVINPSAWAPGQLYVALSRCTDVAKIHLTQPLAAENLVVSEGVKRFYAGFEGACEHAEARISVLDVLQGVVEVAGAVLDADDVLVVGSQGLHGLEVDVVAGAGGDVVLELIYTFMDVDG